MLFALLFCVRCAGTGGRNFYAILGLRNDCGDREIEKAFQTLSRKYHPDKNKGNTEAADRYRDINDAYAALRDPQKRRIFDLYGEQGLQIYESPSNELTAMIGLQKQHNSRDEITRTCRPIHVVFPVDLADVFHSRRHTVEITRRTLCRCPHPGFFCAHCRGRPTQRETVQLSLFVERGCADGTVVVFPNAGDTSEVSAAGSVEVEIVTKPHPVFRRDGSDLHAEVRVSLKEALLGFTRVITGLDGKEIRVEASGPVDVVRIPGRGLPIYLGDGYGDVIVHVCVEWPDDLSLETRKKLADAIRKVE